MSWWASHPTSNPIKSPGVWSPTPKIYGVPFAGSENTPPDLGNANLLNPYHGV